LKQLPETCKTCGGKCCTSPLLTNREIRIMMTVVGDDTVMLARPNHEGNGWHRLPSCPALTPQGCAMKPWLRPIVCRLYPFQFIAMPDGGYRIMLDVDKCPAWQRFGEGYQEALREFKDFLREEKEYAASSQS